ncbi:MAG TPA: HEAT repeat domain-containing protein [Kofleriaceae bacterium]|nr:HEAT repeat domain-containing protein [Kofleriaceae bacterium]
MKNIGIKLAAVALVLCAALPAYAGKDGSALKIKQAIASTSVDAILAEVERAEALACDECIQLVTNLTEDARYEVRAVAAWWFAKRPALKKMLAEQFDAELLTGGTVKVRNAADFLSRTMTYTALPNLRAAIKRDVGAEAKLAIVRAVHYLGHKGGNEALTVAMTDRDPTVRAEAARAWRDIYDQVDAGPVLALLGDADASVRAEAATVVGGMKTLAGRGALEALVVSDGSPIARRNAAWALGKLGQAASRDALTKASGDESGLVRMTARAALGQLR